MLSTFPGEDSETHSDTFTCLSLRSCRENPQSNRPPAGGNFLGCHSHSSKGGECNQHWGWSADQENLIKKKITWHTLYIFYIPFL